MCCLYETATDLPTRKVPTTFGAKIHDNMPRGHGKPWNRPCHRYVPGEALCILGPATVAIMSQILANVDSANINRH